MLKNDEQNVIPDLATSQEGQIWLRKLLEKQEVMISFIKKDGTLRKMTCTLSENKIPEEKRPKNSGRTQNSDSIAVFDVEKSDWRSFRWDSVKEIYFSL